MVTVGEAGGDKRCPETGSVSVQLDVNSMTKRVNEGSMHKLRRRPASPLIREPLSARGGAR
jgi:hypothetical protein